MKKIIRYLSVQVIWRIGNRHNIEFEKGKSSIGQTNRELLLKIIRDNAGTEYGRKYQFAHINSVEEYKKRVPVTDYADYKPYIDRMIENKETNLITAYPVVHYNVSSGTLSDRKYIPYTKPAVKIYERYGAFANVLAHLSRGNSQKILGKPIFSSMSSWVQTLPCGATYGCLSEAMMEKHRKMVRVLSVCPSEIVFLREDINVLYFQARFMLQTADIGCCILVFCTQLLQIMKYIEVNKDLLIDDIRNGTINSSIQLSNNLRKKLRKSIKADPERASLLEYEFSRGFKEIMPRIWPDLCSINAVSGGGFELYRIQLRYYMGENIDIYYYGFAASEGIFALCREINTEDALPIASSCFFEFLPEGETDYSKTLCVDQLQDGKEYELIITNLSGFYRYRMKDIVGVSRKEGTYPLIHFVRRINQCLNLMGEKVEEKDILISLTRFTDETGVGVTDYAVYPHTGNAHLHYEFFIEAAPQNQETMKLYNEQFIEILLNQCAVLNLFISRELITKPVINWVKQGTFEAYKCQSKSNNQFKQIHILDNEKSTDFFRANIVD